MMRWIAAILLCSAATASVPERLYTAESYDVNIQVDLANQRLAGEVKIKLHSHADFPISALELDAGGLQIVSVLEGQSPQWFERNQGRLLVTLTKQLHSGEQRIIDIRYQAAPSAGLAFFPDQVYGSNVSDWMPCNDRPGERPTLHLVVVAAGDVKIAASGKQIAPNEWQLDSPAEPSRFGFALGTFTEQVADAGDVKLRILGAGTELVEPTKAALKYLAERTGKPYPGSIYTQVVVHGNLARSMSGGLTLLSKPDDRWLLVSELAQQWYGESIASKDWADLWLSKGLSAFLADEFLGKERYEQEVEHSKKVYEQIRDQGKDRSLSDVEYKTREEADGEIPLHKGVWFLHQVKHLLGDSEFLEGLRLYTNGHWGQLVTSFDLQKAFDAVNRNPAPQGKERPEGKESKKSKVKNGETPLDNLFDLWVYGMLVTKSK
jgi:aminopeptidase N